MKLSTIIAKVENGVSRGVKAASRKASEINHKVRIEVRANRIAEGEAERARIEAQLQRPIDTISILDASKVIEAAEIDERARAIEDERLRKEELKAQRQARKDYARQVLRGDVPLPPNTLKLP